jgi:hypothetical protein
MPVAAASEGLPVASPALSAAAPGDRSSQAGSSREDSATNASQGLALPAAMAGGPTTPDQGNEQASSVGSSSPTSTRSGRTGASALSSGGRGGGMQHVAAELQRHLDLGLPPAASQADLVKHLISATQDLESQYSQVEARLATHVDAVYEHSFTLTEQHHQIRELCGRMERAEQRAEDAEQRAERAEQRAEAAMEFAERVREDFKPELAYVSHCCVELADSIAHLRQDSTTDRHGYEALAADVFLISKRLNALVDALDDAEGRPRSCSAAAAAAAAPAEHPVTDSLRRAMATPFSAYRSARQYESARTALSEANVRLHSGGHSARDADAMSLRSAPSARSHAKQPSHGHTASASLAPTVPVGTALPSTRRHSSLLGAACGESAELASPHSTPLEGPMCTLKPAAQAQLAGTIANASNPAAYVVTLTQQRTEQQLRDEAIAAAQQREQQRAREAAAATLAPWRLGGDAEVPLRPRDLRFEAMERELEAVRSELSRVREQRDGGDSRSLFSLHAPTSSRSAARRGAGGGDGGDFGDDGDGSSCFGGDAGGHVGGRGGRGGGHSGGGGHGGGDGGGDGSGGNGNAAAARDGGGFDDAGNAITRVAVTFDSRFIGPIKLDKNCNALILLQDLLPDQIRSEANVARQKLRWPPLRNTSDFGCDWFKRIVGAITSAISAGGGNHPRIPNVRSMGMQWAVDGAKRVGSDAELLQWLFAQLAIYFEDQPPAEVAANLIRWSLRKGLMFREFLVDFGVARSTALSMNKSNDSLVLSALMSLLKRHYSSLSHLYAPFDDDLSAHTSAELLSAVSVAANLGHRASEPDPSRPVYPTDLPSYATLEADSSALASGSGAGSRGGAQAGSGTPTPRTAADKEGQRRVEEQRRQQNRVAYMVFAAWTIAAEDGARECFNCRGPHGFVNCDQPYNKANWDAAVDRLQWVAKFRPDDDADMKRLVARAKQAMERNDHGKKPWGRGNGGRFGGGRGGGAGRGRGRT